MNPTQIQTTLAPILGIGASFLAARGWFGFDQNTWMTLIGSVGTIASIVWGAVAARKTAMVTTVANMPEVKDIKLTSSAPASLTQSTPSNVNK
jgi:tetrahydromethanopterin S-methyltransferase subunit C